MNSAIEGLYKKEWKMMRLFPNNSQFNHKIIDESVAIKIGISPSS